MKMHLKVLRNLVAFTLGIVSCVSMASAQSINFGPPNPDYGTPVPAGNVPTSNGMVGAPYTPLPNGVVQPVPPQGAYQQVPYGTSPQPAPGTFGAAPSSMAPSPPAAAPAPITPYASQPMRFNNQPMIAPGPMNEPLPKLNQPWQLEPNTTFLQGDPFGYNPRVRDVPVDVYVQEGQTGRFSIGGSVNSDLGVAGQVILEERNFDYAAWPNSQAGLLNGAFRGGGQNFRMELMPGNRVQRYTLNWTEPNLFGYSPFSLSLGGFFFTRIFRDWSEQRLGGRAALGYEITRDLSISTEIRGEDVKIFDPSVNTLPALNRVLGSNDLYTGRVRLAHNTRDSPFLPTEGHLLEFIYDQNFGEFDFPRGQVNWSKYYLVRERADGGGRHTFTTAFRLGFTGTDTPIFENFFAGGYSTLRGFQFRGAGPVEQGVQIGGRFQFLGSLEYMFPITADDMLRMVAFVDYGTIEKDIEIDWDNFRVAPGLGFRVAIPALGPAPLAFDFAVPVAYAEDDTRQVFSFSMGVVR
jgi:outer membrane protein insertion porin family